MGAHQSLRLITLGLSLLLSFQPCQGSACCAQTEPPTRLPNPFEDSSLSAESPEPTGIQEPAGIQERTGAQVPAELNEPAELNALGEREEATDAGEAAAVEELAEVQVLGEQRDPQLAKAYTRAYIIDLEGPIFGRFHWYLNQRLDKAQQSGADLVILRLTTPGGDLEQSLQLARRLRDINWATTVVYIPEEAISGGAILALGCDRILMRQGALIGDAGPIRFGLDGQFQHAEEKVVSFLASAIRELAQAKGRPAGLAEAMVDRSVLLFSAVEKATGKPTVLTRAETQLAGARERYTIGEQLPESGQNRFLTVGAERALELNLCDGVFASEQDMLEQFNVTLVEATQVTWIDKTVYFLNRPWLTAILLIVGLIGLYLELVAPGISVAGLVAMLCFGIFFWSHALGGTSGWLEVLLFVLGVGCLICELFVLPGFGIFGLSGLALVIVSLVMASQDFLLPTTSGEWGQLQTNSLIVLGAVLGVLLLFIGQVVLLDSIPGLNRFRLSAPDASLSEPIGPEFSLAGGAHVAQSEPISIGDQGVADSDLRPSGKVTLSGQLVDVVTEGDFVERGTTVEVLRVVGNRVVVRKTTTGRP